MRTQSRAALMQEALGTGKNNRRYEKPHWVYRCSRGCSYITQHLSKIGAYRI